MPGNVPRLAYLGIEWLHALSYLARLETVHRAVTPNEPRGDHARADADISDAIALFASPAYVLAAVTTGTSYADME